MKIHVTLTAPAEYQEEMVFTIPSILFPFKSQIIDALQKHGQEVIKAFNDPKVTISGVAINTKED